MKGTNKGPKDETMGLGFRTIVAEEAAGAEEGEKGDEGEGDDEESGGRGAAEAVVGFSGAAEPRWAVVDLALDRRVVVGVGARRGSISAPRLPIQAHRRIVRARSLYNGDR